MVSGFYKSVYDKVKEIPFGKVATYGQIATLLGRPKSAKLVGWALSSLPFGVPWHRVVNRQGMISIENLRASKDLQAKILKSEGIKVIFKQGNYWVDLKKYLWQN